MKAFLSDRRFWFAVAALALNAGGWLWVKSGGGGQRSEDSGEQAVAETPPPEAAPYIEALSLLTSRVADVLQRLTLDDELRQRVRELGEQIVRPTSYGRSGGQLLQSPHSPILGLVELLSVQNEEPHLSGRIVLASDQPPIQDDGGSDPRS